MVAQSDVRDLVRDCECQFVVLVEKPRQALGQADGPAWKGVCLQLRALNDEKPIQELWPITDLGDRPADSVDAHGQIPVCAQRM